MIVNVNQFNGSAIAFCQPGITKRASAITTTHIRSLHSHTHANPDARITYTISVADPTLENYGEQHSKLSN